MNRMGLAWRRSLLGYGVVLGLVSGCGSRTPIDLAAYGYEDAGEQPDAKPDVQYDVMPDSATCNPSKCPTGCCNAAGCQVGTAASACGKGGYVCVDCTAFGASCDPSKRECTQPQPCSAGTCPTGCCADTFTCVAGTSSAQCGKGGEVCRNCTTEGKFCSGATHSCSSTPTCGPGTCSGCCDANDTCHTSLDSTTCGLGGKACQNCAATGGTCDVASGSCINTACNPSSCAYGCCDASTGQCLKGLEQSSCGYGGEACHPCSNGASCQPTPTGGGVCTTTGDCGPWNCSYGCCDYGTYPPVCAIGTSPYACGSGGQACQYCAGSGQQCVGSYNGGQCMSMGECNASTCPWGCCDPSSYPMQCLSGTDPWSCGSNGQACQYCAGPGQQCVVTYSGGYCSSSGSCDPSNCPGCCDYNSYPPVCVGGWDQWACGLGGMACQMCDMTQKCDMGKCVGGSECSSWNCSGCCDYSFYPPVCQPGFDPSKCGANGAQCLWCDATQKCSNGACVGPGPCGPGNCSGCCDAVTGQCMSGTSLYACGMKGETCNSCSGPNQQCVSNPGGGGYCEGTSDCGPWNCPGCCDYNSYPPLCVNGTDPYACGSGGNACSMCPAGSSCQWGSCVMQPNCGPGTCMGCCNATVYPPVCMSGTDAKQCGSGGQTCETCSLAEKCVVTSSGGGQCQSGATCGPASCQGCCDWNGNCASGDTNSACGIKGSQCTNCFISGQICDPASGQCVTVPNCSPYNCAGCCSKSGTCEPGFVTAACGHGGTLCENCANTGGYCQSGSCTSGGAGGSGGSWYDGGVGGAGGSSANCPANYPGCSPSASVPQPTKTLNACSAVDLKNGSVSCSGDPTPPSCGLWYQQLKGTNPGCYTCLLPFTGPMAFGSCLAPFLTAGCNHDLACSLDCQQVACAQCDDATKQACQDGVWSGTCAGYTQGLWCAQTALQGQGAFCQPTGDYGAWIYAVGNHYCGTGTP